MWTSNNNRRKKYSKILIGLSVVLFLIYYIACLPKPLFDSPYSRILEDKNGYLMSAAISKDGQWRFPPIDSVPHKFEQALIHFEDKRFFSHWGVDFLSLGRAIKQNVSQGKVVSGASTLSMQVIRLSAPHNARTIKNKLFEMIKASRLEWRFSKSEILNLYASHAPFGGNVVGLEAACWRYYGKAPSLLSWSEAATLAVLPNAPRLIHPGRNRKELRLKRDKLLQKLKGIGKIDSLTYKLALEEPIPDAPKTLPRWASHLLHTAYKSPGAVPSTGKIKTSIDIFLQKEIYRIMAAAHRSASAEYIHNNAALIIHVPTGKVHAYIGNAPGAGQANQENVDIIMAPRSTGSILKPFLYALSLHDGKHLPYSLIQDTPLQINGYAPKNFNRTYAGVVPFSKALSKSLNVPFVSVLQEYKHQKFYGFLQQTKFSHIKEDADHYGLSLILGGAEASLWDLCSTYAGMARSLNNFTENSSTYRATDFDKASWLESYRLPNSRGTEHPEHLGAGAIWHTFKAMQEVKRPDQEGNWQAFDSALNIAWKTGTSFGFRDAWAIGVSPEYVVGVWCGNADGEGRPNLIGVKKAAPIMFDIFKQLPQVAFFDAPYDDLVEIGTCSKSGDRVNIGVCPKVDTIWVPTKGIQSDICTMHQIAYTNQEGNARVNAQCYPIDKMKKQSYFTLNPTAAYYYKRYDPAYKPLPPWSPDCQKGGAQKTPMEFIYPRDNNKIYIPIELDGELGKTIFKVAHIDQQETLYWHLNDEYLGSTTLFHELALQPPFGENNITVIDTKGNQISKRFEILNEGK